MPRPGTDIKLSDFAPVGGAILDTGQTFFLGVSARGPVDRPTRVRSLRDYERHCGPRAGGVVAHNSARALFTEGGGTLYFGRLAGAGASSAEATVGPLAVSATSPGVWGNDVAVGLEADEGLAARAVALLAARDRPPAKRGKRAATRADDDENGDGNGEGELPGPNGAAAERVRVTVSLAGQVTERSPLILTAEQAIDWAREHSINVTLDAEDPAAALEATPAVRLTGGADDNAVTPTMVEEALERFEYSLGPGQVAYPGNSDPDIHALILDHCDRMRRVALLDLADTADETLLAADAISLYPNHGARLAAALAPPLRYPGPVDSTTVLVPYSAVQAGIIARNDAQTGNPNQPSAGDFGVSRAARGLAHEFTDDVREELNEIGITLAAVRNDTVRTYGSRTVAGPDEPNWKWFGGSRVVMAIAHEADDAAERYVHRQIDGRRRIFTELEGELRAICVRYFGLDALYGESPEEAFRVDTGPDINTLDTITAGEIHGAIWLATAPPGEWVLIEIARVPIETPLAA